MLIVKKHRATETGATIIEVLLAGMVGLAVCLAGLYVMNAKLRAAEETRITKESEGAAEDALSALSANAGVLSIGGSLTGVSDNVLTLTQCTPQTCDYVLQPEVAESFRTSPARGLPYGSPLPSGSSVAFLRRWRIEDENADYRLRKITVAILKDVTDNQPSWLGQTTVRIP